MKRLKGVKKQSIFMGTASINKNLGPWGGLWLGGEAPETGKADLTDKPRCAKGGRETVLNFKQGRANNFSISDLTLKQCIFISGKSVKMLFQ